MDDTLKTNFPQCYWYHGESLPPQVASEWLFLKWNNILFERKKSVLLSSGYFLKEVVIDSRS